MLPFLVERRRRNIAKREISLGDSGVMLRVPVKLTTSRPWHWFRKEMDENELRLITPSKQSSKISFSSDASGDPSSQLLDIDDEDSLRPRGHYTTSMFDLAFYRRPRKFFRLPNALTAVVFMLAGAMIYEIVAAPTADRFDVDFARFWQDRFSSRGSATYPVEFFGNVLPVPCHSHNDYWRQTPLFAALGSGCVSIEADVWLKNGNLYVGHTENSLRENMTLQSMYIEPLTRVLETINAPQLLSQNPSQPMGVFYNDPAQALTLLVDFKTPSGEAWPLLLEQLRPLRDAGWLAHWNGTARIHRPIIIVASGSVDFETLVANHTYRDVFYDAPLDALEDDSDWQGDIDDDTVTNDGTPGSSRYFKYNPSNCHFASAKLSKAIGPVLFSNLSPEQLITVGRQIRNARERHLIPRYWGTPRWPRGLRDAIWASLVKEEVGLLNVDDLRAMRKGDWGIWP